MLNVIATVCVLAGTVAAGSEEAPLAAYFGFDAPRYIVVDDGFDLAPIADVTGDGLGDVVVINNRKSRIEIHATRRLPRDAETPGGVNELGESEWYDRIDVSVPHRVQAALAADIDGDGRTDLLYAGLPAELVALRQTGDGAFEPMASRRVRGIAATRSGFALANVLGDAGREIVTLVDGRIGVFGLSADGAIGEPVMLGSGDPVVASYTEDFNGDGLTDVLGVSPEADAPLRVWLQSLGTDGTGTLGAERRFETPPLREVDPVRRPGREAAAIAVIERQTRRVVLEELERQPVELRDRGSADDAPLEISTFQNPSAAGRAVVVADIDGDGLDDVLATDPAGNRVEVWRQRRGRGLMPGAASSSFKNPSGLAVGPWGDGPGLRVFVLSTEENVVGVSSFEPSTGGLGYPVPISLRTAGATPVAMAVTDGRLAVAVKVKRDYSIDVLTPDGGGETVRLPGVRKAPSALRWADADQDGTEDLLVLTDGEPMVMIPFGADGAAGSALGKGEMKQFGLVSEAGGANTTLFDIDGDGLDELVIAESNFVRACRYDDALGWRVVEQITDPDPEARYVGVSVMRDRSRPRLVVADSTNGRLKMYARGEQGWVLSGSAGTPGIELGAIFAGTFDGKGGPGVLAVTAGGFAHALLSGERWGLHELGSFRSDADDRLEHEIGVGDVNGDGFTDLVVLDAQDQMCEILTVTRRGRVLFATEFQVFESRSFGFERSGGFEPRQAVIGDVTGDGAADLLLVAHDRVIVYPQSTGRVSGP